MSGQRRRRDNLIIDTLQFVVTAAIIIAAGTVIIGGGWLAVTGHLPNVFGGVLGGCALVVWAAAWAIRRLRPILK